MLSLTPTNLAIGAAVAIVGIIVLVMVMSPKKSAASDAAQTPAAPAYSLPAGITNGMTVRCPSTGKIFAVKDNTLRYYKWDAYVAAGKPAFTNMDCAVLATIPAGADM